jgi:hypothetical protein
LMEDEKIVIRSMVEESMILIKDLNTGDVRKAIQINSSPPQRLLIKNLDTGKQEEATHVSASASRFMYDSDASSTQRDSSPRTSDNDPANLGLGNVICAPASVLAEMWWKNFLLELPNHICRRRKNSGPRPSTVYMHEFDRRPLGIMMTFADRPTQTGAQVHSIAKPQLPIDIGDFLVAVNGELVTMWPTQVIDHADIGSTITYTPSPHWDARLLTPPLHIGMHFTHPPSPHWDALYSPPLHIGMHFTHPPSPHWDALYSHPLSTLGCTLFTPPPHWDALYSPLHR